MSTSAMHNHSVGDRSKLSFSSGYHAFIARRPSTRAKENARLEIAIEVAHVRTRKSYGPLRLQDELHDDGFTVSIGRIRHLRKKLNIRCKQLRKFKMTTISSHCYRWRITFLNKTLIPWH